MAQPHAGDCYGCILDHKWKALAYVQVGDVAAAHIKALDPSTTASTSYLASGPKATWKDVVDVLETDYPEAPYKLKVDIPGVSWPTDTTKAVTELGIQWTGLEQVVHRVMDQQLGLLKRKLPISEWQMHEIHTLIDSFLSTGICTRVPKLPPILVLPHCNYIHKPTHPYDCTPASSPPFQSS
jgi:hypothetical protein